MTCPSVLALLRFVTRKLPMPSKHRQRDVLRHACRLERVMGSRDRHAGGHIAGREQLVDPRAGAGDEAKARVAFHHTRRKLEREDRLDRVGISVIGIGNDRLVGRETAQRGLIALR